MHGVNKNVKFGRGLYFPVSSVYLDPLSPACRNMHILILSRNLSGNSLLVCDWVDTNCKKVVFGAH